MMRTSLILLIIIIGGPIYVRLQAQNNTYVRPTEGSDSTKKEPDFGKRPIANDGPIVVAVANPETERKREAKRPGNTAAPSRSDPDFQPASDEPSVGDAITRFNRGPKRILRIIQFPDNTSLFVYDTEKIGNGYKYTVLRVDEPLTPKSLREQIKKYREKTFIGVHRLDDSSYLMVFYGR